MALFASTVFRPSALSLLTVPPGPSELSKIKLDLTFTLKNSTFIFSSNSCALHWVVRPSGAVVLSDGRGAAPLASVFSTPRLFAIMEESDLAGLFSGSGTHIGLIPSCMVLPGSGACFHPPAMGYGYHQKTGPWMGTSSQFHEGGLAHYWALTAQADKSGLSRDPLCPEWAGNSLFTQSRIFFRIRTFLMILINFCSLL